MSSWASIIVPIAILFGFAFNSSTSATIRTISNSSSIPSPVLADTGIVITSPPQSSGNSPLSASSVFTLSGLAPSLSILLIATIIGTPAAFEWLIASIVCGITPSSAATTRIDISVTFAPLERIAVNASCPGVSKNTILLLLIFTV